jgi:drug/metabolite transporter (DMT)-like permease
LKNRAWIFLLLCNLLWSGNIIFGKFVTAEFSPLWITFLRWAIAIFILFPIAQWYEKPKWIEILRKHWFPLAIMGVFGGILFNSFTYLSLEHTSPTNVALISALNPAFIMIFSYLFLREKISFIQIIGLVFSLFGVVFILTEGAPFKVLEAHYNIGDLLMLVVDVCWAIYSTVGKRLSMVTPLTTTTISSFFGVIMMVPFVIAFPIRVSQVTSVGWIGILYIGIFASVCAFVLWNSSVRILGASKSSITMNLVPIYTAAITIILGGKLNSSQILGGTIVFIGMILTTQTVIPTRLSLMKSVFDILYRQKRKLNNNVG